MAALNTERERHKSARHPLELLLTIFEFWNWPGDKEEMCSAWDISCKAPQHKDIKATTLHLLICHVSIDEAMNMAQEMVSAMMPSHTWTRQDFGWKEMPPDQSPSDEVAPGVYRYALE